MPFEFFENGMNNNIIQSPNDYFREQQQAAIDQLWDCTSSRYTVKEQCELGSDEYSEIEVWIDYVTGMTSRGVANGDDFRKLLFRDINHSVKKGLYYQFDDNTWITYFTDNYSSLDVDIGIRRCNNVMKIVDPENGSVFCIPCVVDYDMTAPSIQVTSSILTPNNHATIMVQGNKDTLRLFKLNTRYILGGRPFKLLAYQNTIIDKSISPDPSLLYLDLFLDERHAKDSIENQVADNGTYEYSIMIDSTDMELVKGDKGTLEASVTLNGSEVKRDVIWESLSPGIVEIDKDGNYEVIGEDGDTCPIIATLKGNEDVCASITINVVSVEKLEAKIIVEPLFNKIRQYETIDFKVLTSYDGKIFEPTVSTVSLNKDEVLLTSPCLEINKKGNNYQIKGKNISLEDAVLYITAKNINPNFSQTYNYSIKVTSMLG